MLLQIFAVYDVKAECYNTPFFMSSNGQAIRAFSDMLSDDRTMISKHPDDFSLYHLGEYDDNNGFIQCYQEPRFLHKAIEFISSKESLSKHLGTIPSANDDFTSVG